MDAPRWSLLIRVVVAAVLLAPASVFAQHDVPVPFYGSPPARVPTGYDSELSQIGASSSMPPRDADLSLISPPPVNQPLGELRPFDHVLPFENEEWSWQLLPDGLIYRSYLAGVREPRLAAQWFGARNGDTLWEPTVGARVAIMRYGTQDANWPEGFELDGEGAAFPRLEWIHYDLLTTDFRFGFPLTYRQGQWEAKLGYFHYCSHLYDLNAVPRGRIEYICDNLVAAIAWRPIRPIRLYAEAAWAFSESGVVQPWQFQFGAEYSPAEPTGIHGGPFAAINTLLRQEVDFSGSLSVQLGWAWRGHSGQMVRLGAFYFNGLSDQGQFYNQFEERVGGALWYDF